MRTPVDSGLSRPDICAGSLRSILQVLNDGSAPCERALRNGEAVFYRRSAEGIEPASCSLTSNL